jgi:hypothetical protein
MSAAKKTLGQLIDEARQQPDEGPYTPWPLHADDAMFVAECEGLLSDLESGVPLSELEDYREVLIEIIRGYTLEPRRGHPFGVGRVELADRCVAGLWEIAKRDYRTYYGRQRIKDHKRQRTRPVNEKLVRYAIELVRKEWPDLRVGPEPGYPLVLSRFKRRDVDQVIECARRYFPRAEALMRPAWQPERVRIRRGRKAPRKGWPVEAPGA